jgi:hypothetical protein
LQADVIEHVRSLATGYDILACHAGPAGRAHYREIVATYPFFRVGCHIHMVPGRGAFRQ